MRLPKLRLTRPDLSALRPTGEKLSGLRLPGLRGGRPSQGMIALFAFAGAGAFAVFIATTAAAVIERRSLKAVNYAFGNEGITWVEATADGMLVTLAGTAPNEAARFRAINIAGSVIDSGRVRDELQVTPATRIEAPRFSIEMLRNDDGIQLIGLLPEGEAEAALTAAAEELSRGIAVADMLETAAYAPPESWQAAFDFGVAALRLLPRSKISVAADAVAVTAIATSEAEKRTLESELARLRPDGLALTIDISAPRPVITPFTLRFVKDAQGARFDACSADTDAARTRILAAATAAGMEGKASCTVGLGVPSPRWAEAAEAAIRAIAAMGRGTVTFSDADISLVAAEGTDQAAFDRALGELEAALPQAFSLDATLPRPDTVTAGPAEFTATLNSEGRVEMRGRLTDDLQRAAVDSVAKAAFGAGRVYNATRLDAELPDGWPVRVLAGLEALAELEEGSLLVREDIVEVSGVTGSLSASDRVSQILSDKLGQGQEFKVSVRYDEERDPLAALPTPEECLARVTALLAGQKITFPPGSAEIDAPTGQLMTRIADTLNECAVMPLEIAGHTDSQGSEEGNRALSQARAEAVLLALQGRRVEVGQMRAVGYGESRPIADNETEDGREANRRIEFTLIGAPAAATVAAAAIPDAAADATPEAAAAPDGTVIPALAPPGDGAACVANITALLERDKITFDPGSDDISENSRPLVAALSELLRQCPGVPIEVAGHTDSQGTERNNRTLSEDRAKAVLVALAESGVDVSTLKAVGYGEDNPIADNATQEGREANRRIEFTLIGSPDTVADTVANTPAAPPAPAAAAAPATTAAEATPATPAGTPDFSNDTSPSVAPQEKTLRPSARPANNG
jgi:OOP family OmpA-OmpF porin